MYLDFLIDIFKKNPEKEAIIWQDDVFTYQGLLERYLHWQRVVELKHIDPGTVTIVEADFSPNSIALFLALLERGCIFVPIISAVGVKKNEVIDIAQGDVLFVIDENDDVSISKLPFKNKNEFYQRLKAQKHPGFVLFSSGSTGKSKAAVHDMTHLLEKFKVQRHSLRTISFLHYDHIGGVNTLLYTLSNAGLIVTVKERSPDSIFCAIERFKVDHLPTSPTFINLVLLSEVYRRYNVDSLKMVTYGTESMPEVTLRRFYEIFPRIKLLQTYGLSEVGVLRSKSRSSDSLWVKIGGEGFETRVMNNMLEIKAESAMLGYLNAPSPFTADGWLKTGDEVEVDGEYIKFLGRSSEIINVGGEKVFPQEVENVIQEMDNVAEVMVYGEKNIITGNIVCARVRLRHPENSRSFRTALKTYCLLRLQRYKIPVRVHIVSEIQYSERFKKRRV